MVLLILLYPHIDDNDGDVDIKKLVILTILVTNTILITSS